jgi:hypothetical protein
VPKFWLGGRVVTATGRTGTVVSVRLSELEENFLYGVKFDDDTIGHYKAEGLKHEETGS